MTVAPDLLARARAWVADDPDPVTRAELESLVSAAGSDPVVAAELAARFAGTLEFGTAGLRGPLGAGPMRMNRVVVSRAAAGLVAYLLDEGVAHGDSVVIGYDARRNSEVFARDTAEVVTGAGLRAMLLPRPLPTPLLAFAVRHLGCVAGVMVTASHNPPQDNGYKVYLGDGSQIVPPADVEIASRLDAVTRVSDLPRGGTAETLGEEVVNAYLDAVAALPAPGPRDVIWVYTPMHGVGGATVVDVARRAGFPPPLVVDRQAEPDPEFPTMAFPNPEEPGAMDLAKELAAEHGADLLIANDPDADRCAVGAPTVDRGWRMLSGDEVGALLADHLLRRGVEGVYAASVVSSSLLRRLAAAAGQPYAETLTGFKWIARVPGLVFGYEEALGYCLAPSLVRDKDGISALVLVLELAAALRAEGRTLLDRLDEMALRHGVHATDQLSVRVADLTLIADAMTGLRATPPELLGGLAVEQVTDLAAGSEELPPTDGLRFRLAGGARVVVRPSGTEPKLKCYLEVVVPVGDDQEPAEALAAARIVAVQRLDAMRTDLAAALGL
jgi:phosphomannomutase